MRVRTERLRAASLRYEALGSGSPVLIRCGEGPLRCSNPVELDVMGYPDPISSLVLKTERQQPLSQRCYVRCRKCPECLKHRARLWTARAIDETKQSTRTWFGTLTLSPDRQVQARYAALQKMQRRVSDVTEDGVFENAVDFIGQEITRFLKRVRKVAPFRYLLVTERHQSGLPHFHLLIHEYAGRISKRDLDSRWRFGFSQFRLVEVGNEAACGYVCKYLSKSIQTRVRASAKYGEGVRALTERVEQATHGASEAMLSGKGTVGRGAL